MNSVEEFDFWCGDYRDNPNMASFETERLLQDMCLRGNACAIEYVARRERHIAPESWQAPDLVDLLKDCLPEQHVPSETAAIHALFGDHVHIQPVEKQYPNNWNQIANDVKQKRQWRCEICAFQRLGSGLLQVHHIDGDKEDNSPSQPASALCCLSR